MLSYAVLQSKDAVLIVLGLTLLWLHRGIHLLDGHPSWGWQFPPRTRINYTQKPQVKVTECEIFVTSCAWCSAIILGMTAVYVVVSFLSGWNRTTSIIIISLGWFEANIWKNGRKLRSCLFLGKSGGKLRKLRKLPPGQPPPALCEMGRQSSQVASCERKMCAQHVSGRTWETLAHGETWSSDMGLL